MRHVAVHDLLRQPFHDGGLADTGLADEHRVVLGPPAEDLLDPFDLDVPPTQRIELVLDRRFGQVAAEFGEQRRLFHRRQRRLLVEQRDDVLADRVEAHPLLHEDRRRHGTLFAQDPEQQVLGPDVVVQETIRSSAANWSTRLVSALKGISTDVETFSRNTVRPSISSADALEGQMERAKMRLSAPCPRGIVPAGGARSRLKCCRADSLRTGREKYAARSFRVAVRTSSVTYGKEALPALIIRQRPRSSHLFSS